MTELKELIVYGAKIGQDQDGYISLTDLWRVAGRNDSKRVNSWARLPTTKELITALHQNARLSRIIEQTRTKSSIYTKRGRDGSTYAHHILALAYAEYLNPEIGIEVREIALRYWSGDVTLLDGLVRERAEQHVEDSTRVIERNDIQWYNQTLQYLIKDLGARSPGEFAGFHNAGGALQRRNRE